MVEHFVNDVNIIINIHIRVLLMEWVVSVVDTPIQVLLMEQVLWVVVDILIVCTVQIITVLA